MPAAVEPAASRSIRRPSQKLREAMTPPPEPEQEQEPQLQLQHPQSQPHPQSHPHTHTQPPLSARAVPPAYLRVLHAFEPALVSAAHAECLALEDNQILQVHTLHPSGWAFGTILASGRRGWFPSNYCEQYTLAAMRPVISASSLLYATVRAKRASHYQAAVACVVSAIRGLLVPPLHSPQTLTSPPQVATDCLTRDCYLVQSDNAVRRERKILLHELSSLVAASKHAHDEHEADEMGALADEMVRQTDRVVSRAGRFLEAVGPSSEIWPDHPQIPQTPPADTTPKSRRPSIAHSHRSNPSFDSAAQDRLSRRISRSLTASARLTTCHDTLLSYLASYIGCLQIQSRSPSQLLATTRQAVQAARDLLAIIDAICLRQLMQQNTRTPGGLHTAKESMNARVAALVTAATDVVSIHNGDDEGVICEVEGRPLVEAATGCVRGAGECVAKARFVLEVVGDFEIRRPSSIQIDDLASPQIQKPPSSDEKPLPPTPTSPTADELQVPPLPSCGSSVSSRPATALSDTTSAPSIETVRRNSEPSDHETFHPLVNTSSASSFNSSVESTDQQDYMLPGTRIRRDKMTMLRNPCGSQQVASEFRNSTGTDFNTSSMATTPEPPHPSEDPSTPLAHWLSPEQPGIMFNAEGQVSGGTLSALVERMTIHDSTPDAMFTATFFLTFRLFSQPQQVAMALVKRYQTAFNDAMDPDWESKYATPIRLRVYNVFKGWLESHWRRDQDEEALDVILKFAQEDLASRLPQAAKRLQELVEKASSRHRLLLPRTLSSIGKPPIVGHFSPSEAAPVPPPIITKAQLAHLRTYTSGSPKSDIPSVLDLDALEIARQLTIKESEIFNNIMPEELVGQEFNRKSGQSSSIHVKAMSSLSTDMAGWVAESILRESDTKRRAQIIKQWIKIGDRCLALNNYSSVMSILCALESSTIARLRKTWEALSTKVKTTFENLKSITDRTRNYAIYRSKLRNSVPPCLPFLGQYLTDLTFVDEGNPNMRPVSAITIDTPLMINFDKHTKTARIIAELQRFQIPYRLAEVPELQAWIEKQLSRVRQEKTDFANLYRRSLLVEPADVNRACSNGRRRAGSDTTNREDLSSEKSTPPNPGRLASVPEEFHPEGQKMDKLINWALGKA
ncbi:Cell division control protein 25 [Neolecta irregularis DAH-3]|uniref:Cell division control protein 25 n=1 Tax=Neolecta irregularis (strain DAH-3) TaxID=1198029 RepID=A0A1U7LVW3_NEOID|nr:Cell division control protein 25 [Neolecta irregularis DAH-3]|eukprot:OLL26815.1 Cell division control protein 25 [Neolecta irregularis DAH-3]